MNLDSVCNLMDDKQLLRKQTQETWEAVGRDCTRTCRTCNSNLISRACPFPSYHPCMHIYNSSDWEICEELRLRELEEAKARAAQMEKTMRWWSDCTANWREKWSKVRTERNRAREEGRQLKLKLEATMKELSALKKINQGLLRENEMEAENIWKRNFDSSELWWMKEDNLGPLDNEPVEHVQNNTIFEGESVCQDLYAIEKASRDQKDVRLNLEILNSRAKCTASVSLENPNPKKDGNLIHSQDYDDNDVIHISVLHLHLHESQKILHKEQKIRSSLEKEVQNLKSERSAWKLKYEELRKSKQGTLKQCAVQNDVCKNEVEGIIEDLEDHGARSKKDMKIWELQAEIERLQSENASEWGKSKILETEKQELDRENRRLKTQVKDLQDLVRKSKLPAIHLCGDLKTTQNELLGINKEFMDLQQSDNEQNKQEQDILAELMRTRKKVEQHKAEAKELSIRVEDLRRKLKQEESKV
ncbi:coiled-coil domain-containing protein 102B isoform X2 [Hemicordylus capensis]|uniref:coiled-coil domain-containing protein 102B isoform X2 n=1 Tax=Hemicordylus capensis TaxID=884348 RepID=UPI0023038867|nr:coiled-coil domain-containing protein 102B isoform X2 [Hemicordylus capensis]